MNTRFWQLISYIWFAAYLAVFFVFALPDIDYSHFLVRDFQRAVDWWNGYPVWLGPDTLGGGYAPGPLFSFLQLPFVAIGLTPLQMPYVYYAVLFLSVLWASRFLAKRTDMAPLFFMVPILCNEYVFVQYSWLNNSVLLSSAGFFLGWLMFQFLGGWGRQMNRPLRIFLWSIAVTLLSHIHISLLFLLPLGPLLLGSRRESLIKQSAAVIGALIVGTGPLIVLWMNAKYLHLFDGAHFSSSGYGVHPLLENLVRPASLGSQYAALFKDAYRTTFELLAVVFGLSIVAWHRLYRVRSVPVLERRFIYWVIPFMFGALYLTGPGRVHYHVLWYLAGLIYLLLLCAPYFKRRPKSLNIVYVVLLGLGLLMLKTLWMNDWNRWPGTRSARLSDVKLICEYLNSHQVSAAEWKANLREWAHPESFSSFYLLKYCLKDQTSTADRFAEGRAFLVVQKRALPSAGLTPSDIIVRLPETVVDQFKGVEKAEVENGRIMLILGRQPPLPVRSSGYTHTYQMDAALSAKDNLQKWVRDEGFERNGPIEVWEAKLCEEPFFCSIYLLHRPGSKTMALISRMYQTRMAIPLAGWLRSPTLRVKCGNEEYKQPLAEELGFVTGTERVGFATPVWLELPNSCAGLSAAELTSSDARVEGYYGVEIPSQNASVFSKTAIEIN